MESDNKKRYWIKATFADLIFREVHEEWIEMLGVKDFISQFDDEKILKQFRFKTKQNKSDAKKLMKNCCEKVFRIYAQGDEERYKEIIDKLE